MKKNTNTDIFKYEIAIFLINNIRNHDFRGIA